MHFLKALLNLPTLLVLFAVLGAVLWYKNRKGGKLIFVAALLKLWVFSTPLGAYILVQPLIYNLNKVAIKEIPPGTNVMVLGGGCHKGGDSPSEHLSNPSLRRVLEGYRIWQQIPASILLFSGTDWKSDCNIAALSIETVKQWGADTSRLKQINPVLNTREEAALYAKRYGNEKALVLVSSALHIPRASRNFNSFGIKIIQAPTDFPLEGYEFDVFDFFPSPKYLEISASAWMEWLARIAGK